MRTIKFFIASDKDERGYTEAYPEKPVQRSNGNYMGQQLTISHNIVFKLSEGVNPGECWEAEIRLVRRVK